MLFQPFNPVWCRLKKLSNQTNRERFYVNRTRNIATNPANLKRLIPIEHDLNIWKRFQTSNKVMYLNKNLLLPESFNDVFLLSCDVHKYVTRLPMNSFQVVRKPITVKLSEAYPQDYINELIIWILNPLVVLRMHRWILIISMLNSLVIAKINI